MFQTEVVDEIRTHILCLVTFSESFAIYGLMWKNMVDSHRPYITV
jgi:F0F1-type ATP synthase membrane subunit c/vacuolar-type H+-ATPase subunit K